MHRLRLHLVCNAHLDPVWQWLWPEAAAEAISTFRIAARFCREFDGFVFNHNEAILYMWIERYEPALFKEIQQLVREGKWNIIGGWYLQPDCNIPSGEAMARQILIGKEYFRSKFDKDITTAANFDSFGHSRGLVQLLVKSGYRSYLFGRPDQQRCPLEDDDFVWVGYDGSKILAHRSMDLYTTQKGEAAAKIEKWISENRNKNRDAGLILWGIGNHGGGPSKTDLKDIRSLAAGKKNIEIIHSCAEAYFNELDKYRDELPEVDKDLRHCMSGCYSSMVRIKKNYRMLENELFLTEKMVAAAYFKGLMDYPQEQLDEALKDMLFVSFHDIVTGSSIEPAEKAALDTLGHGLEITTRLKTEAMLALASQLPPAKGDSIPLMIYNPHPFEMDHQVVCEFSPSQNNFSGGFMNPFIYKGGRLVPSQTEQPLCSINIDGRKRVVFNVKLAPGTITRCDCRLKKIDAAPKRELQARNGKITFNSDELKVVINCKTGLIDNYSVNGRSALAKNAFSHIVCEDTADSWGTRTHSYKNVAGAFKLMSGPEGSRFSAVESGRIASVRVVEDGPIRSIVEAVFEYGNSAISQRYILPKQGTLIELETRVHWNEKDRMLKMCIPMKRKSFNMTGQGIYGFSRLDDNENELTAQKWIMMSLPRDDMAITCINDGVYGCDRTESQARITLLRSPAYCGAKCMSSETITPLDRFTPRMDQGVHVFRFWIDAGSIDHALDSVERKALVCNEQPYVLPCFPPSGGDKRRSISFWSLDDDAIVASCAKKAQNDGGLVIRLFEPTGKHRKATLKLGVLDKNFKLEFSPFEIKTLKISKKGVVTEADLLEKKLTRVKRK